MKTPTQQVSFTIMTVIVVGCLFIEGCAPSSSSIRVRNLTGHDLSRVAVSTNAFGALKAGATSEYRAVSAVFKEVSVYTVLTNNWQRNQRFMGGANTQLKSGSYTYDLRLSKDGSLEATLVKD